MDKFSLGIIIPLSEFLLYLYTTRKKEKSMLSITKEFEFAYGHKLKSLKKSDQWNDQCFGKCQNQHGHNAKLKVTVISNDSEFRKETGMIINFVDLKKVVNDYVIDELDHTYLNDKFELPTCENTIEWIAEVLIKKLPKEVKLYKLELSETSSAFATWEA